MNTAVSRDHDFAATERLPRIRHNLLRRLMRAAPFQPATNLWRAVEVAELAQSLPATGSALDLGCGDGELTIILRDLVGAQWRLVGVDPDRSEAAAALATGAYHSVHATGATSVAEPAQSFDLVFANSVLEHIPNLSECLREAARLLKTGGLLAATVPSPHFHRLLRGPGRFSRQSAAEYLAEIDRRLAHVNYWSAEQWRDELMSAGFEPPTFHGYLSRRQLQRWESWSHWTGGLLYRLQKGRRHPIAIQRSLGLRRRAPAGFGGLASFIACLVSYGVMNDSVATCEDAGCWLVLARRSVLVRSPKEQPVAERIP